MAILLGAGFSATYICINTVCGPQPIVTSIEPLEVPHGEEAGIIGDDFGSLVASSNSHSRIIAPIPDGFVIPGFIRTPLSNFLPLYCGDFSI